MAIVIQARMTSSRLPGKVLIPVLGTPLLEYQIERLRRVRRHDVLAIATTTNDSDGPIVDLAQRLGVEVVRGSELDVLDRYLQAARELDADVVVRSTSDEPLVDPAIVDALIDRFLESGADFAATFTTVPTWPTGLDTEVMSRDALERSAREATEPEDREHVTQYAIKRPELFRTVIMASPEDLHHHRWTVDTPQDLELVSRILTALYPRNPTFTMADVLALIAEHPDWEELNRGTYQSHYGPGTEAGPPSSG